MDPSRKFEQSELTKLVVEALEHAIEHVGEYGMKQTEAKLKELKRDIEIGHLDVSLKSRLE